MFKSAIWTPRVQVASYLFCLTLPQYTPGRLGCICPRNQRNDPFVAYKPGDQVKQVSHFIVNHDVGGKSITLAFIATSLVRGQPHMGILGIEVLLIDTWLHRLDRPCLPVTSEQTPWSMAFGSRVYLPENIINNFITGEYSCSPSFICGPEIKIHLKEVSMMLECCFKKLMEYDNVQKKIHELVAKLKYFVLLLKTILFNRRYS